MDSNWIRYRKCGDLNRRWRSPVFRKIASH